MTLTPPPPPPPPLGEPTAGGTPVASRFSRRHFLAGAGVLAAAAAGGALAVTRPWQSAATAHSVQSSGAGKLVLVTLYGGNDGLNTLVPYSDPAYLPARPTLGYQPSEVLTLADGLGLSPKLPGLQALWKSGNLAVVRGVGYPNPNLSHFASMAIWQTANVEEGTGAGWLGRWLDAAGDGPERAISFGATLPPVLRGEKEAAAAITGPSITLPGDRSFQDAYVQLVKPGTDRSSMAAVVSSSGQDLLDVKQRLDALLPSSKAPGSASPSPAATDLKSALGVVSQLIAAGSPAQVYQVSLESFDTHADEKANHERLLTELDDAVSAFFKSLQGNAHGSDVVLMTYSEFGRRPAENASGGTDHGTASVMFVAGPKVKGGRFYGEQPSLADLDTNGNLKFDLDFRQVYATVLERVIGTDPAPVLGGKFEVLDFV